MKLSGRIDSALINISIVVEKRRYSLVQQLSVTSADSQLQTANRANLFQEIPDELRRNNEKSI